MERAVALKKLSKMLGKSFGYRVDPSAPTPDDRAAAKTELPALIAAKKDAQEKMEARYKELLADPEYQRLKAAFKNASDKAHRVSYTAHHHYKITVGTTGSMFFHIKAQGDSWEDVIAQLNRKSS